MDDFGNAVKKKPKHKKSVKKNTVDDFDAEWDSIPTKVYEPPKEPTPPPQPEPTPPKKKKKKKKGHKKEPKETGAISEIYSADKTGHVIEYGIQHDEIRKQRAQVKAIKDKQRQKKAEARRKEEEALKRHQELLSSQRLKNKAMKHKKRKSLQPRPRDPVKEDSPALKPEPAKIAPPEIPKPKTRRTKSGKIGGDQPPKVQKKVTKRRLSKLKHNGKMEPTVDVYSKELALLKEENVELKKQVKMGEFIKKKYDLAKNENTLFKQQVAVLNEENEALKEQNEAMKEQLVHLHRKLKVMSKQRKGTVEEESSEEEVETSSHVRNKGILNGNKEAESEESENEDNKAEEESEEESDEDSKEEESDEESEEEEEEEEWDEWEPEQIADWIISLDAKYKKYEKTLRETLDAEEMHGSLLGELDLSDLARFGIKNVKHQKAIMIQLKRLTKA